VAQAKRRKEAEMNDDILGAEELSCGVWKFHPKNGGWGIREFETHPTMKMVSPDKFSWYTLGKPSVIRWRGSEYGHSGHGVAILQKDGQYVSWYKGYDGLQLGPEDLSKAGVDTVFSVRYVCNSFEVVSLQTTTFTGSTAMKALSIQDTLPLTKKDVSALRSLVNQLQG